MKDVLKDICLIAKGMWEIMASVWMHFAGNFPVSCDFWYAFPLTDRFVQVGKEISEDQLYEKIPIAVLSAVLCVSLLNRVFVSRSFFFFSLKNTLEKYLGALRNYNRKNRIRCEQCLCQSEVTSSVLRSLHPPATRHCLLIRGRSVVWRVELITGRSPEAAGSEITGSETPLRRGHRDGRGPDQRVCRRRAGGAHCIFTFADLSQHLCGNFANQSALPEQVKKILWAWEQTSRSRREPLLQIAEPD